MLLSDIIARMIEEMLDNSPEGLELQRNDLASSIGCVPSQINYVITSRFTPQRGYIVESRRGGGGYIRITRVRMDSERLLMHLLSTMPEQIDYPSAAAMLRNLRDNQLLSEREEALLCGSIGEKTLEGVPAEKRGAVRSDIFRHSLMKLYSIQNRE